MRILIWFGLQILSIAFFAFTIWEYDLMISQNMMPDQQTVVILNSIFKVLIVIAMQVAAVNVKMKGEAILIDDEAEEEKKKEEKKK